MHIKHRKGNVPLWIGVASLLVLSFLTYKQNEAVVAENFKQKLQTFDFGYSNPPVFNQLFGDLSAIISNKIWGSPDRPGLERVDIDIPIIEYNKILQDRETALKLGGLINPTDVRAKIRYRGHTYKAKIRLKGDLPDHWTSQYRMSFRVSLKGGKSVLGYRKFSLHKPLSRQFPFDHAYTDTVRKMGNLAPPHNYINVYVNGMDWGVMDIEEHLSKEFLEKQGRKDSFIVRFGNEQKSMINYRIAEELKYHAYRLSDPRLYMKVYDADEHLDNSLKRRQITYIAQQRLKHDHSELYDARSYGRALVLAAIWNDAHPLFRSNSRHYFNPYTLRLEPITADSIHPIAIYEKGYFPRKTFDPFINNVVYSQVLRSQKYRESVDALINEVTRAVSTVKQSITRIQSYFPLDKLIDISPILEQNIEMIHRNKRGYLLPEDPNNQNPGETLASRGTANNAPQHVRIVHRSNGAIALYNLVPAPVMLNAIGVDGRFEKVSFVLPPYRPNLFEPLSLGSKRTGDHTNRLQVKTSFNGRQGLATSGQTLFPHDYTIPRLPGQRMHPAPTQDQVRNFSDILYVQHFTDGRFEIYNLLDEPVELLGIYLNNKDYLDKTRLIHGFTINDFSAVSINTGLKGLFDDQITIKASYAGKVFESKASFTFNDDDLFNPLLPGMRNQPPAFIYRTGNNEWKIESGTWEIRGPVTIDGNLSIAPGARLIFSEDAYLIIKGSLHAVGTQKRPISFSPINQQWMGLYIVGASSPSKLVNVSIENTTGLTDGLLSITGGVTFYQSDVDIKNLFIAGSSAEDSLNIVGSKFSIDSIEVNRSRSDAIDFDFSDGSIRQSKFASIGGDALDFSGSEVGLESLSFYDIHDKAISAGEGSTVRVSNLKIRKAGVGIASKDGSNVSGENIDMDDLQLGAVMSYMKKSFYPLPVVELDAVHHTLSKNGLFRQKDTHMRINGKDIEEQHLDVDKLYETETMAK